MAPTVTAEVELSVLFDIEPLPAMTPPLPAVLAAAVVPSPRDPMLRAPVRDALV